jgi:HNH endonuclease
MFASLIESRSEPVTECGCWIWLGSVGSHGYGDIHHFGRHVLAHRASYESFNGPIPEGMFVLHSCDNRVCVNPAHLSLGTHSQNMADKMRKGRWAGQGPPKLCKDTVVEIRRRRALGEELKSIAAAFDVHPDHVRKITNGKIWTKV